MTPAERQAKFATPITLTPEERDHRDAAWQEFLKEPGTALYVTSEATKIAAHVTFWRAWSLARALYRPD